MKKLKKELIGFIPQDPKSFLNPFGRLKEFLTKHIL